ncbi:MAG: helix-turn-helix transcriptional regulator [Planctomycetaceae bacterium]|nr:ArsR family transcriptional regulator [Planctomycetota bacterium]NUN53341.1 helix-turn-helix transcriptional regulator [Planctomycetaceae bacterium]
MDPCDDQDAVFRALAHAHRRRILDLLRRMPGASVNDLCKYFDTSRIAVMKHLSVLVEAGLVHSEKHGRTRSLHFDPVPLRRIHDRWTDELGEFWAGRMLDVKRRVEARATRARERTP